ncbi:MAG TPA: HAD family hydrolase [Tepidisphaeraceae bacterium]|nr:HAD family hydrolase [Tepidisphaeraceae bacterium]
MRRAIFLDRDGVLIRTFVRDGVPHPPQSIHEVEVLPAVAQALVILKAHGFALLVVTNQPDVARGTQTRRAVEQVNDYLRQQLPLDGIFVCFHDTADCCACRKPAPGLLLRATKEHDIDLSASFMVGDRASDIVAGAAAGCRTFLIEQAYSRAEQVKPTYKAADLREVAEAVLRGEC